MAKYRIQLRENVPCIAYQLRVRQDDQRRMWLQMVRIDDSNYWAPVTLVSVNNQRIPDQWIQRGCNAKASSTSDFATVPCIPAVQVRSDVSEQDFEIEVLDV